MANRNAILMFIIIIEKHHMEHGNVVIVNKSLKLEHSFKNIHKVIMLSMIKMEKELFGIKA